MLFISLIPPSYAVLSNVKNHAATRFVAEKEIFKDVFSESGVTGFETFACLFRSHLENTDTAGTRPEHYTSDDLHAHLLPQRDLTRCSLQTRQGSLFAALVPGVKQLLLKALTSPSNKELQPLLLL